MPKSFRSRLKRVVTPVSVLIVGGIVTFAVGIAMAGDHLIAGVACIAGGVMIAYGLGLWIEADKEAQNDEKIHPR